MIKRARRAIRNMLRTAYLVEDLDKRMERLERIGMVAPLSPIDRHVTLHAMLRRDGLFDFSYPEWRTRRIDKLLAMYGIDYFKGRRVLELGAGLCEIGAFLAELGAEVTCLEGRAETITMARLKHRHVPNLTIEQADLEQDFSHYGRFDMILHLGLLYHIGNVDEHLAICWGMADEVVMETVVCDSLDPHKIVYFEGRKEVIEESIHGSASRPSPFYVERLAAEAGFGVQRLFDADLNSGAFIYDWEHKDDGDLGDFNNRRAWRFYKPADGGELPAKA